MALPPVKEEATSTTFALTGQSPESEFEGTSTHTLLEPGGSSCSTNDTTSNLNASSSSSSRAKRASSPSHTLQLPRTGRPAGESSHSTSLTSGGDDLSVTARMSRRDATITLRLATSHYITESPRYLVAGCVLGMLGFIVAATPFFMRIAEHLARGEAVPMSEVPPTVSEMVSKWDTTEARVFFGFELTAANMILLSWYPYKLRNSCCIPMYGGCQLPCNGPSWATFRQFGPAVGLVLVACCPTVSMATAKASDWVLISVHGAAAMLMFGGFLCAEAHTLSIWPFKCSAPEEGQPDVEANQLFLRTLSWMVAAFCFSVFFSIQGALCFYTTTVFINGLSFGLEVVAGLAMLFNHWVIWFYCTERTRRDLRAGGGNLVDRGLDSMGDRPRQLLRKFTGIRVSFLPSGQSANETQLTSVAATF
mmetsp:Transcript_16269/g.35235  ORF Transcript_16269/g.35235 Transcript_16269/m.35235 type:complete len:421 (-) Transcript_16269:62-1324(-)